METRQIPRALFEPLENLETDELLVNPVFLNLIKKETVPAIQAAVTNKKTFATLFEINRTGLYIDIPKQGWIPALEQCIKFLLEEEKFEDCIAIKKLIDEIKKPVKTINRKSNKKGNEE